MDTNKTNKKKTYAKKEPQKESVDPEVRKFVNPVKPLMTEEDASRDQWNHGSTEHVALPRNGGTTDLQIYGSNTKY